MRLVNAGCVHRGQMCMGQKFCLPARLHCLLSSLSIAEAHPCVAVGLSVVGRRRKAFLGLAPRCCFAALGLCGTVCIRGRGVWVALHFGLHAWKARGVWGMLPGAARGLGQVLLRNNWRQRGTGRACAPLWCARRGGGDCPYRVVPEEVKQVTLQ